MNFQVLPGWGDLEIFKGRCHYRDRVRPIDQIDTLFIHRLALGYHISGPRYFEDQCHKEVNKDGNPAPREVSIHFICHRPGWIVAGGERRVTQMENVRRRCWHAGRRRWNNRSIGVELDGPYGSPFPEETIDDLVALAEYLRDDVGIPLRYAIGHSQTRKGRRDPGPDFPWDRLSAAGLEVLTGYWGARTPKK